MVKIVKKFVTDRNIVIYIVKIRSIGIFPVYPELFSSLSDCKSDSGSRKTLKGGDKVSNIIHLGGGILKIIVNDEVKYTWLYGYCQDIDNYIANIESEREISDEDKEAIRKFFNMAPEQLESDILKLF